jgi:outer membrane protein assembly factor BamB
MPVLCGDVLVIATDAPAGEVMGLDAASGRVRWRWGRGIARVAGEDSLLVVALRGGRILRLAPDGGVKRWETRLAGAAWRDPAVRPVEHLALIPVRPDSLVALRIDDGSRAWSRQLGAWPAVASERGPLAVVTEEGHLILLDPASGADLARAEIDGPPAGPPVVEGDAIYQTRRDGTVMAFDAATLARRWTRVVGRPLVSGPAVRGGMVYQAADRGLVHVLRAADGTGVGVYPHPEPLLSSPAEEEGWLAVAGSRGMLVLYRRDS